MKSFIYKDVSEKIDSWPYYGKYICSISADTIIQADKMFIEANPSYVHKGNIKSIVTVTIAIDKNP